MRTNACLAPELKEIWTRSRPTILARIATIEAAAARTDRPPARERQIEEGVREAHRLAGTLGTFGLDRGTELARELERALADPGPRVDQARLQRLASELRAMVELTRA